MAFSSNLGRCPIIGDDNYEQFVVETGSQGGEGMKGYEPRDYEKWPEGSLNFCAPFDMPLIPESEWEDRIEKKEKDKSRLSDVWKLQDLPVLSQGRTNYCWMNGVIHAMMALRAANNQPFVSLSPASAAAKIKNYKNKGGWGGEAVEGINEYGVCNTDLWPANSIERRYDTDESRKNADLHRMPEWFDLDDRNDKEVATCLLSNLPVPAGYNWWGHLICLLDLLYLGNGKYGYLFINSWGANWGDHGFGILKDRKMTPDGAVAPRTTTISRK